MSSSPSRSRSPVSQNRQTRSRNNSDVEDDKDFAGDSENFDEYSVVLENVHEEWDWQDLRKLLQSDKNLERVRPHVKFIKKLEIGEFLIEFRSKLAALAVQRYFSDSVIDGRRFIVKQGSLVTPKKDVHSKSPEEGTSNGVTLRVMNIPKEWKWQTVKDFVCANTTSPMIKSQLEFAKKHGTGWYLEFQTNSSCRLALAELGNLDCQGKKLEVSITDSTAAKNKRKAAEALPRKPVKQAAIMSSSTNQDQNETYGLSLNFLKTLNIQPPLQNKVFVSQLSREVNENKIRDVFCHAGQIHSVVMIMPKHQDSKLMAKVEYDHPVEAVQAVSMFNGHEFYGSMMSVQMDKQPHQYTIPPGLTSIGRGLGSNGEPLKGIRNLLEIEPLKKQLAEEIQKLKFELSMPNHAGQHIQDKLNINLLGNPLNLHRMAPLNINTVTPFNSSFSSIRNQSIHPWQGLLQQNSGNDLAATLVAIQSQNIPKNISGFSQKMPPPFNSVQASSTPASNGGSSFSDRRVCESTSYQENIREREREQERERDRGRDRSEDRERNIMTSSDMLIFRNLPASVTLQALNNKMREVGELKFAEMTGEGRAIVRFLNVNDAERCVKLFDRSKVDGQTIEVKFF